MIYAGYVKVAPGKPQTGQVKLKIPPGTGEAKFSLGEGKKSTGSCVTGSVTEGCANISSIACRHSMGLFPWLGKESSSDEFVDLGDFQSL